MRTVLWLGAGLAALAPFLWHVMHDYQRQRIMTLLDPERDPLGTGYHIIQSKIAIGSGGAFGKGWLSGSQAHLNFLPEHATDFIYSVAGEEFAQLGTLDADVAAEAHGGEEGGLGGTDAGVGGLHRALGGGDVGAAFQQG